MALRGEAGEPGALRAPASRSLAGEGELQGTWGWRGQGGCGWGWGAWDAGFPAGQGDRCKAQSRPGRALQDGPAPPRDGAGPGSEARPLRVSLR